MSAPSNATASELRREDAPAVHADVRQTPDQPYRLRAGGLVDRSRHLSFSFDGRPYSGYSGDTLASALLANGVRLVGRSFKYHRPRGILSAGAEEPNALVELRTGARREPNTRATTTELFDGLEATSQNRWPSLNFDVMAINSVLSPILGAGFYYKTFMWPAAFWEKVYEPLIRRAAGLGRAPAGEDPDHYEKAYAFCDVLVIGAGAAGLMAALAAGRSGARVILCEEDFRLGGRLLSDRRVVADRPAADWVEDIGTELESLPDMRVLRRTTVLGAYDGGTYAAVERVNDHLADPPEHEPRQRLWRIVAKRCVLAAGAIERPLVFGDNDRPGIMLAGSVRTYLNRFATVPGRQAVIFANNDEAACSTARDLARAGIEIAAVVDPRPTCSSALRQSMETAGIRLICGAVVTQAAGRQALKGAVVVDAAGARLELGCDLLAMSGGWSPTVHLASHHGGRPVWDETIGGFKPGPMPVGMTAAGAAAGIFGLADTLATGARAGVDAAASCGLHANLPNIPEADPDELEHEPFWRVRGSRGKAFVDFQNDVTVGDVELADREGFRAVEHLKRYTTLGMATDQGKTANVNGLALMADLTERTIAQTGTTVFRPPYAPVTIGALVGHHRGKDLKPIRLAPTHAWASGQGAVFVEAGLWLRAQYFPHPGERSWLETVNREVTAVRSGVGVCDVSTLGKIDVQGRDAGTFLDRIYCNTFSTLPEGRARYGVMLREDGFVMDDGTTSRLGANHFLVTTTTGNAARVMQHLEFCHQCLWPELDVALVSVSEQWAQLAIAGPRSRDVLRGVVDSAHDVSNEAVPYMAARSITVGGGIPARLFRISFSGELAYELAVPASYGDAAIRAVMAAGERFGIVPYGTEAMGVMRIEKGHAAGNELNGQTTARDLGLARMMSSKKDFVGRAMAGRPALMDPDRPTLVGLQPCDRRQSLGAGAHLLPIGKPASIEHDEGYVTSTAYSPTLGHPIALALLKRGPERLGERVIAVDPVRGRDVEVEICHPVFVDPEGVRLRA